MFSVWNSVKVTRADHPRVNQAGTVHATSPDSPGEVTVKFDVDGHLEAVAVDDLMLL